MNIVDRIISPNIWDEVAELGYAYSTTNGNKVTVSNVFTNLNKIYVISNNAYYFKTNGVNVSIIYYDENNNFIGSEQNFSGGIFTTPNNCSYIRFNATGSTYNHDICINESNPSINGKYFPYVMYKRYDIVDLYRKWNQLVKNGNFVNGTTNWGSWSVLHSTISVSNKVLTQTFKNTNDTAVYKFSIAQQGALINIRHKYLISFTAKPSFETNIRLEYGNTPYVYSQTINANTKVTTTVIVSLGSTIGGIILYPYSGVSTTMEGYTIEYTDIFAIDLTVIYGSGNEPTTVEQFLTDYPEYNNYVEYGSGEWQGLIGSNANKIKRLKIGG